MKAEQVPATSAVRVLRAAGVAFTPRFYAYVDRGGTRHSAEALNVPEHEVVKTLVMEARRSGRRRLRRTAPRRSTPPG